MIIEAWFFLLAMHGSGKAATVVGPFTVAADCEATKTLTAKSIGSAYATVVGCWKGPVVQR